MRAGSQVALLVMNLLTQHLLRHMERCPNNYEFQDCRQWTHAIAKQFSAQEQICNPCFPSQYIVDQVRARQTKRQLFIFPVRIVQWLDCFAYFQREICQNCPTGAICNGYTGQLTGLSGSSWRREGNSFRVERCAVRHVFLILWVLKYTQLWTWIYYGAWRLWWWYQESTWFLSG